METEELSLPAKRRVFLLSNTQTPPKKQKLPSETNGGIFRHLTFESNSHNVEMDMSVTTQDSSLGIHGNVSVSSRDTSSTTTHTPNVGSAMKGDFTPEETVTKAPLLPNEKRECHSEKIVRKKSMDESVNKQRKYSLPNVVPRNDIVPTYKNYQLLGDSQLVRFSEQVLNYKSTFLEGTNTRRIGYCVSGQKTEDLYNRLCKEEYKLHNKVAVLIGTNDLVYNTDLSHLMITYTKLIQYLVQKTEKILLITVPPVPKNMDFHYHWTTFLLFNRHIESFAKVDKVHVVDFGNLLVKYPNSCLLDYYEKFYGNSTRSDLIHLNIEGFKMLQYILNSRYFTKHID